MIPFCEAQARARQESGKSQAMIGEGWPSRRKASKLKPLPRAYIKVGCHPPTHHQCADSVHKKFEKTYPKETSFF